MGATIIESNKRFWLVFTMPRLRVARQRTESVPFCFVRSTLRLKNPVKFGRRSATFPVFFSFVLRCAHNCGRAAHETSSIAGRTQRPTVKHHAADAEPRQSTETR